MPATNVSPQLLNDQEVIERLKALRQKQPVKYTAFYSSQLGGIVTDPALMVLPFDDHMVHRGHGIFDTAGIVNGQFGLSPYLCIVLGAAAAVIAGSWRCRPCGCAVRISA